MTETIRKKIKLGVIISGLALSFASFGSYLTESNFYASVAWGTVGLIFVGLLIIYRED